MPGNRNFVKFSVFKADPAWRRSNADLGATDKQELSGACEGFDIQIFHSVLGQPGLAFDVLGSVHSAAGTPATV